MAEPHTIAGAIPAARTLNPLQPEDAYVIVTNTIVNVRFIRSNLLAADPLSWALCRLPRV